MADLSAVLRKTIDGLPHQTPQLRAKVYERARAAIVRQVEAANPPLAEAVAAARMSALEDAIERTEEHYRAAEAEPAPAEIEPAREEPSAIEPDDTPDEAPAPTEPAEPDQAPMSPEPPRPVAPPPPMRPRSMATPRPVAAPSPYAPASEAERPRVAPEPPQSSDHYADDAQAYVEERYAPSPEPEDNEPAPPVSRQTWESYRPLKRHPEPAAAPTQPSRSPAVPQPYEDEPEPSTHDAPVFVDEPEEPENYLPESHSYAVGRQSRNDYEIDGQGDAEAETDEGGFRGEYERDHDDGEENRYVSEQIPPADLEAPRMSRRRGPSARTLASIGIGVVLIAGGALAWAYRSSWEGLLIDEAPQAPQVATTSTGGSPAATPPSAGQASSEAPSATAPGGTEPASPGAGADGETDQVASAATQGGAKRRFTQRLLPDGTEVDEGPAEPNTNAFDEGTNIAAASPEPSAEPTPSTQPPATNAPNNGQSETSTPPPAASDTATPPAAQGVPVAQNGMFYEERSQTEPGRQQPAQVVWSLVNEPPADGEPAEPAIRAVADVSEINLKMTMTIRRNTDVTLPASHVIELNFDVPPDFPGGQIANIQRLALKPSEQSRGEPLVGVAGKISDGFFIIALNDLDQAVKTNLQLLKNQEWIDIPISYSNGRRALLSIEKGVPGDRVFEQAFDAWSAAKT
ncbi:hypothetical protein [Consotaella salsifontis]|uniref:Uncharacterized protein n=1 Tax=Consotaella salsifontis TaxID=1365950 RepID=A0A1T4RF29_9HYPH|nr:hypothetical protein [Consotaella salsifontis]SKA14271.1 hypothetical protein SAMN05428963_106247 [Consotaella salsifontis]